MSIFFPVLVNLLHELFFYISNEHCNVGFVKVFIDISIRGPTYGCTSLVYD